jgi:hypothetical protein
MVATATMPARTTASQHQRHADRIAAAQQHPVAGLQPHDPRTSHLVQWQTPGLAALRIRQLTT